ncbi:MAG: tRNA lysidine(34) synthetase TilS [Firmicutes bacterium]|nr:tRNA lysidine(34) synthetase TilS [Bacillota bacterium]
MNKKRVVNLEDIFLKNIREKIEIKPGYKILVAVSGGMDSVLLLYLLNKYSQELGINIEAAHVNHMLRGKDSDKDQEYVRELCDKWSIPFHTIKIDVKKISKKNKWSLEEGARKLRYDYLNNIKGKYGCNKIAVAHHQKDQAETILMHLIRGTGAEGLRGMFFEKDDIVRPLLNITREDIEKKINEIKLEYRTDKSNLQTKHTRNKIRLKLLPILKKYNPQIENNLVKTGEIIGEDNSFIQSEVDKFYKLLIERKDQYIIFNKKVIELHPAIRRRLIIEAYKDLTHKYLEYKYVIKADDYLENTYDKKLGLPNDVKLYFKNNEILLDRRTNIIDIMDFETIIDKPGQYEIADKVLKLEIITEKLEKAIYNNRSESEGYVDFNNLSWPLLVRNRKAGDIFYVMGDKTGRKLKKLFIEKKIDRENRDKLPLIFTENGELVFIPGLGVSELAKINDNTEIILHFSYR